MKRSAFTPQPNLHAIAQQVMEFAIGADRIDGGAFAGDGEEGFLDGAFGQARIKPEERRAEPVRQEGLALAVAAFAAPPPGEFGEEIGLGPAQRMQEVDGRLLDEIIL